MSELKKYLVEEAERWSNNVFDTVEQAETYARQQTHRHGEPYGIYVLTYSTVVPEHVLNIAVEKV
jgi:hypothetical protein